MIKFLKNLFGLDKPKESDSTTHPLDGATRKAMEAPYKIETPPAPIEEPIKVEATPTEKVPKVKKPAKPKATVKPKAEKVAKPKAPRKPKMTVAK